MCIGIRIRLTGYVDINIMKAMSTQAQVNFAAKFTAKPSTKNSPPPEVPFGMTLLVRDNCLCLHLQRAARTLARRFDLVLKPTGLTNGQFSMLMSLNRPDLPEVPPATVGNVAELLGMDRTTVTAAARILARRGLLHSEVRPSDRRTKVLKLTAKGMQSLSAALPIWTQEHNTIERELGAKTPERLRRAVRLIGGL